MPDTDKDQQGQREAYQQDLEAQLKEGLAKLDQLKAKAEKANARARIGYYELIDQLWDRQQHLRLKVDGLKQVGAGVWEEMKGGIDRAWVQLKAALEKASDRMK